MATQAFVDSVIKEIIEPGVDPLMAEERIDALKKHYGLNDKQYQFFTVHAVADQEHTAMAAEVIAKHANTERQMELVREAARQMVRFKIAKFKGIYNAYG